MSHLDEVSVLLSDNDYSVLVKPLVITLLFGGGLIPSLIQGNKDLIGTLTGKRRGGEENTEKGDYISESGASGGDLPGAGLIFASERIPLVDIIAIMGRIKDKDSIADWNNLDSTKLESINPIMWLPRSEFKKNIRAAKFKEWPTDALTGDPIGGKELEKAERKRISTSKALIGDAALDAVFDSWAWGASIATPDKVETTLALYRKGKDLDLKEFVSAASRGRAVTGVGALTFVVIQVVAFSSFLIAPALRQFANIDIGFGQLGSCDGLCNTLF